MADAIDGIVENRMRRGKWAGVAVGLACGDDATFRCYGSADLENDVPVTAHSVFRIGSLTKQYTAALVLKLTEQRRLSLDDEITKFFPDYPVNGRSITVHHLLAHTSGLPNYGTIPEVRHRPHNMSPEEIADEVSRHPHSFEPGERCVYNNFGYHLLGLVIEKVTEKPFRTCVREYLADPLGLDETLYLANEPIVKNRVRGYTLHGDRLINAAHLNIDLPYAAGAMGASIRDVLAWQHALNQHRLLNEDSLERMRTPTPLPSGVPNAYGYGVAVASLGGVRKITHSGGINGFASVLSYYPDEELTVAVLINTQPANPLAIESQIARELLGRPLEQMELREMTPDQLGLYCGAYDTDAGMTEITEDDGALVWRGQRFTPTDDHTFVNTEDPESKITFSMTSNQVEEARVSREGIDTLLRPFESD